MQTDLAGPAAATAADVDAWVRAARVERLDLHYRAASPSWREREDAFAAMSAALARAIDRVQALHAAGRDRAPPPAAARFGPPAAAAAETPAAARFGSLAATPAETPAAV